jgi:hypothetical protein
MGSSDPCPSVPVHKGRQTYLLAPVCATRQRRANTLLTNRGSMPGGSISADPDAPAKLLFVSVADDDDDGFRARGEQAIGELAQALLDSQVLENALSAAFGAREKAIEAQQAAMAALNVASASDLERLERRLRSLSQRFDEIEDQIDRVAGEVAALRRQRGAAAGKSRTTAKD